MERMDERLSDMDHTLRTTRVADGANIDGNGGSGIDLDDIEDSRDAQEILYENGSYGRVLCVPTPRELGRPERSLRTGHPVGTG